MANVINERKRPGRPKGRKKKICVGDQLEGSRRPGAKVRCLPTQVSDSPVSSQPSTSTGTPSSTSTRTSSSTSTRTPSSTLKDFHKKFYLVGHPVDKLGISKLPKNSQVLARFLAILEKCGEKKRAAKQCAEDIRIVWKHHFGLRLVYGKDIDSDTESEGMKLVVRKEKIEDKILQLFKTWTEYENTSKRKERSNTASFTQKEKTFIDDVLDMPMNIAKRDLEGILESQALQIGGKIFSI